MEIKIKKLEWEVWSGHTGNSYMAKTPIGDPYCIWLVDSGFKCSVPSPFPRDEDDRKLKHSIHGSLDLAKQFCQEDFEYRIYKSLES